MQQKGRFAGERGAGWLWRGALAVLLAGVVAGCGTTSAQHPKATPTATQRLPVPPAKGWNAVTSPPVGQEGRLSGVAALSASDAWAVGQFHGTDSLPRTLAEHWNGSAWSVVTSPSPGQGSNELVAAAMLSASDVWAVGDQYNPPSPALSQPLIEHWDGASWSVVPVSPPGDGASLAGVAGTSANDIWAVGLQTRVGGSGQADTTQPLIEHWNGTAWTVVPGATLPPASYGGPTTGWLNAVVALSANNAWAVGTASGRSLIEHWDGAHWVIVPDAGNTGGGGLGFSGIAAVSASDIWAVGSGALTTSGGCGEGGGILLEHWDGSRWSDVAPAATSRPGYDSSLTSVAAVAAHDVWAVGSERGYRTGKSGADVPLIEHWDGTRWSVVTGPTANTTQGLTGVAAAGGTAWSVGQFELSNGAGPTLVERWDGSRWSAAPSPSPGTLSNELHAVAAVAATDVWSVGSSAAGTLAEHWDGQSWMVAPTPNGGSVDNEFDAVSATASSDVWAAGATGRSPLLEHWNGSAWSVVTGDATVKDGEVRALSARTTTDAWAVGAIGGGGGPLAERWDGSRWRVVQTATSAPANIPLQNYTLLGVAALGANDVWIVGGIPAHNCGGIAPALIEHFDGSQWTIVPNLPQGVLYGISAVSASDIWAVGTATSALAMHWDGKQWTQVSLPQAWGKAQSTLTAVSARASNDVWAVGTTWAAQGQRVPLVMAHWDGSQWTASQASGPGAARDALTGVAIVTATDVWAVGYEAQWDTRQALIERYGG